MKFNNMISVEHNPGDPPIKTDTDWATVAALTDEQVHAAALSDPDAQPLSLGTDEELAKIRLHRIPNVKKLRERFGLTQESFPATYRIRIGTLRDWEQGRELPDAAAGISHGHLRQPGSCGKSIRRGSIDLRKNRCPIPDEFFRRRAWIKSGANVSQDGACSADCGPVIGRVIG